MAELHPIIIDVLERIKNRSKDSRAAYLAAIDEMANDKDQDNCYARPIVC